MAIQLEGAYTDYQLQNHFGNDHFGMILRNILRSLAVNSYAILRIVLRMILKLRIAIELRPGNVGQLSNVDASKACEGNERVPGGIFACI